MSNGAVVKTKGGYYVGLNSSSAPRQKFSPHALKTYTHMVSDLSASSLCLTPDFTAKPERLGTSPV